MEYDELRRLVEADDKTETGLLQMGATVGQFIVQILKWLVFFIHFLYINCEIYRLHDRENRLSNLKELGRRLGEAQLNADIHFTPEQWKDIRQTVVSIITKHALR